MQKRDLSVVTTFTGVGFQERGLEDTGLYNIDVLATCETDINAIIAYAAVHKNLTPEIVNNYPDYPSRDQMALDLAEMHIGYDFVKDKEYNWFKLVKAKDSKQMLQKTWLACKLNKNVGDITRVYSFPKSDLFTFSFPCTDLSVAGKQAGMIEGQTRSGLVYEVLRILKNMKETDTLPTFLLMENVDALINKKNKPQYEALNEEFKELGYECKYAVMNTKFTGIPQNRSRVYGLYYLDSVDLSKFEFPLPFDNGIRLKDVLEDEVDEKYYINNEKAQTLIDELIQNGTLIELENKELISNPESELVKDGVIQIPKEKLYDRKEYL